MCLLFIILLAPDASVAETCEVSLSVLGDAHAGEAEAASRIEALRAAYRKACAALTKAEPSLDCEDRVNVLASVSKSHYSKSITNGEMTEKHGVEITLRFHAESSGTGTGADRKAACRAAAEVACRNVGTSCPPRTWRLLAVDGLSLSGPVPKPLFGKQPPPDPRDELKTAP